MRRIAPEMDEGTKIYVFLTKGQREALKEHCRRIGVPMSTFVRMIILREIGWNPVAEEEEKDEN